MRLLTRITLSLLVLLASVSVCEATTYWYWVHPDGTAGYSACRTTSSVPPADVSDHTKYCPSSTTVNNYVAAGDTVYLRDGNYTITGYAISPLNSGTSASNRITYSGYTSDNTTYETAIIKGAADVTGAQSYGINLYRPSNYIKITHLTFSNLYANIQLQASAHHNEISYCTFHNTRNTIEDIMDSGNATNTDNSTTTLEDTTKNWTTNHFVGKGIYNETAKFACGSGIASNTATTATSIGYTGSLTRNYWRPGDKYRILYPGTDMSIGVTGSSHHNWIHHNTVHDAGSYTGPSTSYGADAGACIRVGVLAPGGTTDYADNNTIEYNHMYHGGHHVAAIGSGKHGVWRGNYFHNEGWFSDANYIGTCSRKENGVCGYRVIESGSFPSVGGEFLFEGNTVGYGAQYGGGHAMNSGSGAGQRVDQYKTITRYNQYIANAEAALFLESTTGAGTYNRIYNNTFYHNGHKDSSFNVPTTWHDDVYTLDQYRSAIYSYDICTVATCPPDGCDVTNNEMVNNLFYDTWSERNLNLANHYYPAISMGTTDVAACNNVDHPYTANYFVYDLNHPVQSDSPYAAETDPKFVNATAPSNTAGIVAAWSNYAVTSPNLNLQVTSPAINVGTYLTTTVGTGSSSTSLVVADASYFQDGTWGSDLARSGLYADWISIGTTSNPVQISSINYTTNTITLASPMTWSNGASIWLYRKSDGVRVLYGSAPDYGAYEYADNGTSTTVPQSTAGQMTGVFQ